MKNENEYKLLILFVIFLLIKKIIGIIVEIKFPTYNDLNKSSEFWKVLVNIRSINEIITFIISCYFLYTFNFNLPAKLIFSIFILHSILYFLIDEQFIYLFVNKDKNVKEIVHFLNTYGDSIENLITSIFAVYAITIIFSYK